MDAIAYRPHYCVWELTLACNLRCGHCGSDAGTARGRELTTAECLDVVDQLAELDCRLITLSGGEPTLRPDWDEIARGAARRGVTVNMVSNGTTFTADLAARVAASGLANVGISVDGPERLHDQVRGPGTFRRTAQGIAELRRAGVPVSLLTHLDRGTAATLEEMHALAVELGAVAWRVQLGKPMGRLCENRERLLDPFDLLTVLPRLAAIKQSSPIHVDVGDSVGYFGPHEKTLRRTAWSGTGSSWSGCQAGRFAIGIESDGGVKGCLSLQARPEGAAHDPFREGSLRDQRLQDLWFAEHAFAFNREQRVEDLTGACRTCSKRALCRGGAKCVAAAFTGAVSEDPYCYLRVERLSSRRARILQDVRRGAATALMGLGVTGCLGGCFTAVGPEGDPAPAAGQSDAASAHVSNAADAGRPDAARPGPDAADPCVPSCPMCDYGVMPPECYAKDAGAPEPGPDAAFPCVCLDYGVMPEPGSCCDPRPADAGVDCSNVCCDCDYGVPPPAECCQTAPPDAGNACENVCCECDYGVPPPPECCK